MYAEIRRFEWPDVESGQGTGDSTILVIVAGPNDGPGEETFHATVCTPEALARMVSVDGVVPGRHFIFVESINTERVEKFVRDRARRISGENWGEVAVKLGRIGFWEFEDYTP